MSWAKTVVIVVALLASLESHSQPSYPDGTVRMIVPYSPGTSIDILARTIGLRLSKEWSQPVIVENRTGASGVVGTAAAARAKADGHTLLMQVSGHVINPHVYKTATNYDPFKDFVPITLVGWTRMVLVLHAKTNIRDINEFIRQAKQNPGKFTYATPGVGTVHHLAMEFFRGLAGLDLLHVPHSNTGAAVTGLLSGTVDSMFVPIPVARPHLNNSQLVVLGVASAKRSSSVPGIPTLAAQGLRGAEVDIWYGMLAPAGLPPAIGKTLNAAVLQVLNDAETRAALEKQGLEVEGSTPEEFRALMERESAKWGEVVRRAGIESPGAK